MGSSGAARTTRPASEATIRTAGAVLFVVAAVLLTSIGGAGIVAAPLTLPLMFLVVERLATRPFRIVGAVIGGLTAAELAWGLVYLAAGETAVLGWVVPVLGGAATVVGMAALRRG